MCCAMSARRRGYLQVGWDVLYFVFCIMIVHAVQFWLLIVLVLVWLRPAHTVLSSQCA